MSRRADKSMVKMYKDLIISKRELIDLRQSVSKTLHGLNQAQTKNTATILAKKKICLGCKKIHGAAAPPCKLLPIYKCPNCSMHFPSRQTLQRHESQNHHQCRYCYQRHNDHPQFHESQVCGQTRLDCEKCGAKVKRKDIDNHITRCCFNNCPKCRKLVYYKAYSYHLSKCQQFRADQARPETNSLMRTKKLYSRKQPISEEIRQKLYLPSSMLK